MAAVTDTAISVSGPFLPTSILLGTSGDTLTYTAGTNQILFLYNTHATNAIVVTIAGAGATTVVVPGAGATTASVAAGTTISLAAGVAKMVRLDTISSYLVGAVAISADTASKIVAAIIH